MYCLERVEEVTDWGGAEARLPVPTLVLDHHTAEWDAMHHDPAHGPTRPPPLPTFPLVCLSHLRPPLTRAPVPEPRRARRCRNSIPARMSGAGGWTWWEELGCWVGGQSALAGSYFSDLSVTVRSDVPRDDGYKAHQGRGSHGSPGVPSGLGPSSGEQGPQHQTEDVCAGPPVEVWAGTTAKCMMSPASPPHTTPRSSQTEQHEQGPQYCAAS